MSGLRGFRVLFSSRKVGTLSGCLRLADVGAFFDEVVAAGIPEQATGWPRAHRPKREAWGGIVGALIDPDGSLIRLIQTDD